MKNSSCPSLESNPSFLWWWDSWSRKRKGWSRPSLPEANQMDLFSNQKNGENDEHDSLPWKTTTTNSNNETNIFIACKQRPSKYGDKTHEEPRLLQESPEDEGFLAILQARRPQACGVFQGFRGWLVGRNGILKGGDLYTHHYLGFLLKWCR